MPVHREFTDDDLDHKGLDGLAVRWRHVDGVQHPKHVLEGQQQLAGTADQAGVGHEPEFRSTEHGDEGINATVSEQRTGPAQHARRPIDFHGEPDAPGRDGPFDSGCAGHRSAGKAGLARSQRAIAIRKCHGQQRHPFARWRDTQLNADARAGIGPDAAHANAATTAAAEHGHAASSSAGAVNGYAATVTIATGGCRSDADIAARTGHCTAATGVAAPDQSSSGRLSTGH